MKRALPLLCLLLLLLFATTMVSCSIAFPSLDGILPFHEHRFGDWQTTLAPTCTAQGQATRTCLDCNAEETYDISKNGHKTELLPAVAPTCTEAGQAERTQCTVCHALLTEEDTTIPASGHTPSETITEAEPTCTATGLRYVECTVCLERLSEEVLPSPGHTPSETITEAEPTCTATGLCYVECTVCFERLSEEVLPSPGHTPSETITEAEPTCTAAGLCYVDCTVCFERLSEEILPSPGHSYIDATCISPATCTVCGEKSGGSLGHTTSEGVCARCGESISELFLYAATVYAEAAGENLLSKRAVAHTIHNRVGVQEWKKYTTITAVITQPYQFNGYNSALYRDAYSYYETGVWENELERQAMDECLAVCRAILEGDEDPTGGATFFHSLASPEAWIYHEHYTLLIVEGTEGFWFYK